MYSFEKTNPHKNVEKIQTNQSQITFPLEKLKLTIYHARWKRRIIESSSFLFENEAKESGEKGDEQENKGREGEEEGNQLGERGNDLLETFEVWGQQQMKVTENLWLNSKRSQWKQEFKMKFNKS